MDKDTKKWIGGIILSVALCAVFVLFIVIVNANREDIVTGANNIKARVVGAGNTLYTSDYEEDLSKLRLKIDELQKKISGDTPSDEPAQK